MVYVETLSLNDRRNFVLYDVSTRIGGGDTAIRYSTIAFVRYVVLTTPGRSHSIKEAGFALGSARGSFWVIPLLIQILLPEKIVLRLSLFYLQRVLSFQDCL